MDGSRPTLNFDTHVELAVVWQANFEAIFANFDHGNKGGLTLTEMWEFSQFQRCVRPRHIGVV